MVGAGVMDGSVVSAGVAGAKTCKVLQLEIVVSIISARQSESSFFMYS
jgi:hypothetical protein